MGIIKTIDEWSSDLGNSAAGLVQNTLTSGANFVCGVRAKYPNTFFDTGFARGILNKVCGTAGVPQPPSTDGFPFTGGQCVGVAYRVLTTVERDFGANGGLSVTTLANQPVPGRIEFVRILPRTDDPTKYKLSITSVDANNNTTEFGQNLSDQVIGGRILDVKVTRLDGLPDDCGDRSPYPTPDPTLDPNDLTELVELCDSDEQGNPINCEFVTYEIPDDAVGDGEFCFTVDGMRICIGVDGFEKKDEDEEEEKEEIECPEDADPPSEECLMAELVAVTVTVTEFKPEGKMIVRPDPQDTTYFAGYFNWTKTIKGTTYNLPQFPIRRERNYYKKPDEADSYRVVPNYGAKISVTEIKEKPKGE